MQVLIAEDDPDVRALVLDVVSDLGHAPSCANDGAEALDLYNSAGADVVVSDWMMPRMNGLELCRCVRSRLGAPYTYFILLTALGDLEHRKVGIEAGADDYLAKPFNLSDIEARLITAERVTVVHRRREALLRHARRFAGETDVTVLLDDLVKAAIELVDGSVGLVTRWDDEEEALFTMVDGLPDQRLQPGHGASARAAQQRAPVLLRRVEHGEPETALAWARPESVLAAPLIHEARLIGTVAVGSRDGRKLYTQEDAELLEMLASTASAALVALERARLDGVLLAARTAQHELNNQLAVARGYAEMLAGSPELPEHLVEMAEEVMHAADDAVGIVRQLRSISHIHEEHWAMPGDTTINLQKSVQD